MPTPSAAAAPLAATAKPRRPTAGAKPAGTAAKAAAASGAAAAVAKAAAPQAAKPAKPAAAAKAAKPDTAKTARAAKGDARAGKPSGRPKRAKDREALVRDGFTMPESDFALIATLKARALEGRREAKKSELLRAGLHALAALDATALVAALAQLQPVKTGRPKKAR